MKQAFQSSCNESHNSPLLEYKLGYPCTSNSPTPIYNFGQQFIRKFLENLFIGVSDPKIYGITNEQTKSQCSLQKIALVMASMKYIRLEVRWQLELYDDVVQCDAMQLDNSSA